MKIIENCNYLKKMSISIFSEIFFKYNLTFNELIIMIYLNENEKNTAKDIVDELLLTKSHVSTSIERLVNNGYIIRKQNVHDKKKINLNLTEKANKILEEAENKKHELKKIILEGLTEEEKIVGEKLFLKMCNNIKKYYDDK